MKTKKIVIFTKDIMNSRVARCETKNHIRVHVQTWCLSKNLAVPIWVAMMIFFDHWNIIVRHDFLLPPLLSISLYNRHLFRPKLFGSNHILTMRMLLHHLVCT